MPSCPAAKILQGFISDYIASGPLNPYGWRLGLAISDPVESPNGISMWGSHVQPATRGTGLFSGEDGDTVLPQALSADGGRYADADTEFWIKGNSATLTRSGKSETCEVKPTGKAS